MYGDAEDARTIEIGDRSFLIDRDATASSGWLLRESYRDGWPVMGGPFSHRRDRRRLHRHPDRDGTAEAVDGGIDTSIYPMPGFVTLAVADLARSKTWYVDVLGFVVLAEPPGPGGAGAPTPPPLPGHPAGTRS